MNGALNILNIARRGLQAEHALEALPIVLDEYDPEFVAAASVLETIIANSVHVIAGLPARNWSELLIKTRLLVMICRDDGRDSRGMIAKLSASVLNDLNSPSFSKKSGDAVTHGVTHR